MVLLRSETGASVELHVLGYQFEYDAPPATGKPWDVNWDANWLVVRGRVVVEDGRTYKFEDPCLTTFEARQLADWLTRVARGDVALSEGFLEDDPTQPNLRNDDGGLALTEPNLAWQFLLAETDVATIRVFLSFESAPPWVDEAERGALENSLDLRMPRPAIAAAAQHWRGELEPFPER